MNTEVHTRVANDERPREHHHCEPLMTNDERHEDGEGKGVGCVTRRETISTTTITIDDMHEGRQRIVEIGRTQSAYLRTYECCTCLISRQDNQSDGDQTDRSALPGHATKEQIGKHGIEWYPYPTSTDTPHYGIEERTMCAIHNKQQTGINI